MACFSVFLHLHLYIYIYNAYRYRNITANYYRNAQGIMLVYDVTSMKSFEAIDNWVRWFVDSLIREYASWYV